MNGHTRRAFVLFLGLVALSASGCLHGTRPLPRAPLSPRAPLPPRAAAAALKLDFRWESLLEIYVPPEPTTPAQRSRFNRLIDAVDWYITRHE